MAHTDYWLSSTRMTVCVTVNGNQIVQAAPIVQKFIGQNIDALRKWMQKQKGYREEQLEHASNP